MDFFRNSMYLLLSYVSKIINLTIIGDPEYEGFEIVKFI